MASDVSIVNAALIKLGEGTIASLTEDSKAARLANSIYADIRDAVLQAHPWNFALARASLSASSTAPSWGYDAAFPLPETPTKCLRVLRVKDDEYQDVEWKVEGREILTDESAPLYILYVKQATDPGQYTPLFVECLAARLAAELAEPLKQSSSMTEAMRQLYERKLAEARTADAQEGTPEVITANEWIEARY